MCINFKIFVRVYDNPKLASASGGKCLFLITTNFQLVFILFDYSGTNGRRKEGTEEGQKSGIEEPRRSKERYSFCPEYLIRLLQLTKYLPISQCKFFRE